MQKGGAPPKFFGRDLGAKIHQNRTQNESKFEMIFKSEKIALQERLGVVLGRSWDVLEAILGSKFALPYTRACVLWKITFFMMTSFPDVFGTDLGR